MRALLLFVVLASGAVLTAAPETAAAGEATCAGQVVTIDLNDPGAPDPERPESDVVLETSWSRPPPTS